MHALILAGGKGTRLAERLQGRPKPLIEVAGEPLLARQLALLRREGVTHVTLLVNHEAPQIAAFCDANDRFGMTLDLVDDGKPRGTAGALLASLDRLPETFFVVYGDTLFDIDLGAMLSRHRAAEADVTLFLHPNDHPNDSDLVEVDADDRITRFHPYPHDAGEDRANLVNAALYVANRSALLPWADFDYPSDLAKDLFPAMVERGAKLQGYRSFEYIKDVGTPARLDRGEDDLRKGKPNRARRDHAQACVFLDRDGTLNELRGYVRRPDDLVLIDGVAAAVRRMNRAGLRLGAVTNQPVIARGDCTPDQLAAIHRRLERLLGDQGAYVDGLWYCPHHPHGGYEGEVAELKIVCSCRKPEAGLILAAAAAFNARMAESWMVGDSTSDIVAAKRAGVGSIQVMTGEARHDPSGVRADFLASDLGAAAELILDHVPRWMGAVTPLAASIGPGERVRIEGSSSFARAAAGGTLRIALHQRGIVADFAAGEASTVQNGGAVMIDDSATSPFEGRHFGPVRRVTAAFEDDDQIRSPNARQDDGCFVFTNDGVDRRLSLSVLAAAA